MLQTDVAKGKIIAPTPDEAGDLASIRAEISLATGDLTLNKIIEMLPLPANCTGVDFIFDTDDLDSDGAPTITIDIGVMSGEYGDPDPDDARTCGAEIFSAATTAQAGGVARPTLVTAFRIAPTDADRGIGVKIHAAPAAAQAGKIGLTATYRG
ncbi:MAG: hypothetical protein GC182_08905 [Rhodopseudomonas sp.]|nr:hypothetical protein [Rhodopseudomonas sp.]